MLLVIHVHLSFAIFGDIAKFAKIDAREKSCLTVIIIRENLSGDFHTESSLYTANVVFSRGVNFRYFRDFAENAKKVIIGVR